MEHIEGVTLQKLIKDQMKKKKDFDQNFLLNIFKQLTSAVTAINNEGMVHRDLKTQNIMLNKDGVIKVIDFGLSKKVGDDKMMVSIVGAINNMSP